MDGGWLRRRPAPPPARPAHVHVMTLGDTGVGKSCIIRRWTEGAFFAKYVPTIGVDYGVKEATATPGSVVVVDFWDTSGHPDFLEVRNEFYATAQCLVLVFDVQSRRTFESLDAWLGEARQYGCAPRAVYAVGNKADAQTRRVKEDDAHAWATKNGATYFEVSAVTGDHIDDLFDSICSHALSPDPHR
jgi:DnaJ family protein C protein 27